MAYLGITGLVAITLTHFGKSPLEISGQRSYEKTYLIEVDDAGLLRGENWIRSLPVIEQIGNLYVLPNAADNDAGAWCNKINVERDKNAPHFWEVVVSFTSGSGDPTRDQPNPLLRPAEFSYSTEKMTITAAEDVGGRAITNAVGDPFDPVPEKDWHNASITVRKNWPAVNIPFLDSLLDCVNSVPFLGFPAGTVKFEDYRVPESKWENSIQYWQVEYVFKRRRQPPGLNDMQVLDPTGSWPWPVKTQSQLGGPWTIRPLNAGKRRWDAIANKAVPILERGTPRIIRDMSLLDADGEVLPWPLTTSNRPLYIEWQLYEEKDLNLLQLP